MHLTQRLPRETGRDYALRTLKDNIVRLELEPGSMVSENELAAQLDLSRTPVREALMELAKVGAVEVYPQRGSAIARIDYELVEEARFMRYELERAVVELDCQMATEEDLRELRECVEFYDFHLQNGAEPDVLLEADDRFHRTLFRIARKELVYELSRNLSIHFDRVRRMSLSAVSEDSFILRDHQAIADAIAARDPEEARRRMEVHLTRYRMDEKAIRARYPTYFKA